MQDIGRQIGIAVRWLPLIVIMAISAGLIAYTYASGRPVVVEANGTLRVDPGRLASSQDRSDAVLAAVGYASEMDAPGFARAVVNTLNLEETPDELLRKVSVGVDSGADVGIIQLGVRSTDPDKAQTIARAFGDELITRKTGELYTADVREQTQQVIKLERDRDLLRRTLRNLQNKPNKTAQDRSDIANFIGDVAALNLSIENLRPFTRPYVRNLPSWVVRPRPPTESVAAGPLYWTLLATLVAVMAALGLAFFVEYLRNLNKIRDERDLELATGLPAIGSVLEGRRHTRPGDADRLVMLHYPRSDAAEAYRSLIARMGFSGGAARSLVIASTKPTDARSVVAANVALAYAEAGRNVILVDADHRSPHLHPLFGVGNERGLTTLLSHDATPLGWATVPTAHPRLGLMPAGPPSAENAAPLDTRQLNALMRRLLEAADMVIFDSPAIDGHIDAAVLAGQLDELVLVVPRDSEADKTEEAVRTLHMSEADFIGAVLYQKVRRSRRGARVPVPAPPAGWDASRPWLHDAPARIPALTRSGERNRSGQAAPASPVAGQPMPQAPQRDNARAEPVMKRAAAPYFEPFQPGGGTPAPTQPAQPAPARPAPAQPAPAQPAPARPAPAQPAPTQPQPLQAVGPNVPGSDDPGRGPAGPASSSQAQASSG